MTEPRYIAVDAMPAQIIKRCTDRACDKYHEYVTLGGRFSYREAREIADALNKPDAPANLTHDQIEAALRQGAQQGLTGITLGNGQFAILASAVGAALDRQASSPFGGGVVIEVGDLRRAWVPEDGDTRCQQCGWLNPVWWASNDDWNRIMGGPEAKGDPGGVLCPTCYHTCWIAEKQRQASIHSETGNDRD